ncbi:MAG TPA: TonB-dependent receptor [Vicinamibacterales bacterium]|jgi:hypothetical protein|nr:TonB-dependent receptor [Vicinamibacterales bacterium]
MCARISAFLVALTLATTGLAAQERFGTLQGHVTDDQGAAVPGVTVTLTDIQTGAIRTFVTDANGQYVAPDLNPGRYNIAFELTGFTKVERNDISVALGRAFELDARMRVGAVTETVQVTAEAPLVDTRSTLIAHNVSAEEFDRLPKQRSFQSIALTAPSVNVALPGDALSGIQVNGASASENMFTVDGIVTNSLVNGQSRQNTVFEYLQEVQVKTSGISAEYGGALGGVVSAVTKSGGNQFHGETHYYFQGSPLAAAPVKRLVLDPVTEATASYVQDQESPSRFNEFGGSLGGPIVKGKVFFYGSYSPRNERTTNTYNFTQGGSSDILRDIWYQQTFGKASTTSRRVNATYSVLWTPTKATGTLATYNSTTPNSYVGSPASLAPNAARGYEIQQVNQSATADVTLTNRAFLSFRGGAFHDRYSDTGIPNTTPFTYQATTEGVPGIPANLQGATGTANTPRAQITGFDTTNRYTFNADYNHVVNAAGFHTFKAGYGFQHVVNDIDTFYPGGYVFLWWGQTFTSVDGQIYNGGRGTYGYYEVNDRRIAGKAGSDIHSLYAQDQWTIGSHLTLNLGIRTENEKVPTFRPDYQKYAFQFGWGDKLAPRLGAAYDIFGDGRVKAFGSWGRYFDWTKFELPRGGFGAETWCIYYRGLDTLDISNLNLSNMPGADLWQTQGSCRDRRVPSFGSSIDPSAKPMSQDSTSGGIEYQVNRDSVFSIRYIHNHLRRTLEDIGAVDAQGNEVYVIGNPGEGNAVLQDPSGLTPIGQPLPKPKRQYDALEIGYNRRFTSNYFFSANYTWSRLYGNYSGLASSDEISLPTTGVGSTTPQQQAAGIQRSGGNENRAFDLDELLYDSHGNIVYGRLATDRPHAVKLYGAYTTKWGTQVGALFYGASGTPMTTYLETANTSSGMGPMINGRGDLGRTPVLTRTDLLINHDVPFGGSRRLRFELNVTNLFNQKTTTYIFNSINRGAGVARQSSAANLSQVNLLNGYDPNALILATPEGAFAFDPRYKMPALFQVGTQAFFDIKYIF